MKRFLTLILLLCHMNFSMFLPQSAETDTFDATGLPTDDINSVVEFFMVTFGYDHTVDDEDDDSCQYFHLETVTDYFYQQQVILISQPTFTYSQNITFAEYKLNSTAHPSYDIIVPPPEA